MKWIVGSVLILSIMLAAVHGFCAERVEGVVVVIVVINEEVNERPIAYCRVYIGDNRALTGATGNFVMLLDPGDYPVRVEGRNITEVRGSNTMEQRRVRVFPEASQRITIVVSG